MISLSLFLSHPPAPTCFPLPPLCLRLLLSFSPPALTLYTPYLSPSLPLLVTIRLSLRVRAADRWKTSFRSQLGQFEWNVVPFGLQGASSLLMRVMNQALTVGLDFPGGPVATPTVAAAAAGSEWGPPSGSPRSGLPRPTLAPIHGGVPGASGPLGRCALVYMDDCLVHSPTLEQHLLDVEEVLKIFRRRQV